MKGLFIPEITAEMFRNGCLEGIEALMAEGKIYDIEYEAEPRRGRWEEREWFTNDGWSIDEWQSERCSVCDKYLTTPYRYFFYHHNYCPNCGAEMRGE